MQCKILLIDDDKELLAITRRYLENHGLKVAYSSNPLKAVKTLTETKKDKPDLIITDAEMPELDGFNVCRIIKNTPSLSKIPIIMISGKKIKEEDMLTGYAKGADDYLVKPLSFPILLAKIKILLAQQDEYSKHKRTIKEWDMFIDRDERILKIKNKKIKLTRKEFDLLVILLSKQGKIVSVPYLLEAIWGYDSELYNDSHTVEVHVSSLRKKIGPNIAKHITKITGHGYKME
ncbi:MAG: response regulator transcription factor [Elusimicrobiales bacterium]|nr:response regulator transcription factor [Elusimicrobiales bacterium]